MQAGTSSSRAGPALGLKPPDPEDLDDNMEQESTPKPEGPLITAKTYMEVDELAEDSIPLPPEAVALLQATFRGLWGPAATVPVDSGKRQCHLQPPRVREVSQRG